MIIKLFFPRLFRRRMIFVFISLIKGSIIAKPALIAGFGHRNALSDRMICQIEAFFCYIFPDGITSLITKQMHQVRTV